MNATSSVLPSFQVSGQRQLHRHRAYRPASLSLPFPAQLNGMKEFVSAQCFATRWGASTIAEQHVLSRKGQDSRNFPFRDRSSGAHRLRNKRPIGRESTGTLSESRNATPSRTHDNGTQIHRSSFLLSLVGFFFFDLFFPANTRCLTGDGVHAVKDAQHGCGKQNEGSFWLHLHGNLFGLSREIEHRKSG